MILVISEKPSVGRSIAQVIGASQKKNGYWEGNGYLVSWCLGHLVELSPPAAYDPRYAKWNPADLPILPQSWSYQVSPQTKGQFAILKQLMNRQDVASIVNACDAGREGELIFRLVYQLCHCTKPTQRLWISSMEDSAIREGFQRLRPGQDYDNLFYAALCRERADWLVGINATRFFSCLYDTSLSIGRVMTPTLAMAVQREAAISSFAPEPFYTVQLTLSGGGAAFSAESGQFPDRETPQEILRRCQYGTVHVVQSQQKEKAEKPPALYDLTTLQRDANRILGFTAQQTLDYAQALYEKQYITYPRTDSRYLTDDMAESLPGLCSAVGNVYQVPDALRTGFHYAQVLNGKKVTDHHAILPTVAMAKKDFSSLPAGEQSLLRLVAQRLLVSVSPPHRFLETVVELDCGGPPFTAKGKHDLSPGWRGMEDFFRPRDRTENQADFLPLLPERATLTLQGATVKEGKTKSPAHFTEDTLLHAMETACVAEFPPESEHTGVGTPATRAGIIEKLVKKGYLQRKPAGKSTHLLPTAQGVALVSVMPESLRSPATTAQWEAQLQEIQSGSRAPTVFMEEICASLCDLIQTTTPVSNSPLLPLPKAPIGKCPHCGNDVAERKNRWACVNRECRFALWKDNYFFSNKGKQLTEDLAIQLLRDGEVQLHDCFSKKSGRVYVCTAYLTTEPDGKAHFEMKFGGNR